ncbi:NADPH-dependent FMN reductase [Piscinibacter koreensis]|uniref:NAD(P)H-dependent oxidoreductase n=1 Tax=Piscinibacter koreensis TaxID=2742824 RepID=A0A7Y6TXH7_9BURK|nr:NAD(P)H-dependent oxidoreductase [Schlegelella koreensis]NUZ07159.1 NAD(P)H-dependent oxidoreductase [Schlegelella koreensis]
MAENIRVAVFVGSLRAESYNRRLALALARLAPETFTFEHVAIGDIPLYNQDRDVNPPEAMTRLKHEVESAQALLFVTPEYNRGIPGVLKNALDTASRPWGKNSFAGKPAGVVGISVGAIGTALAQHQLRNVLAYLDVPTLGQPEVYLQFSEGLLDDAGNIYKDDTRRFLQGWVDAYVAWVRRFVAAS